eukprot:10299775-Ditylum_brightwellii.AAC.1
MTVWAHESRFVTSAEALKKSRYTLHTVCRFATAAYASYNSCSASVDSCVATSHYVTHSCSATSYWRVSLHVICRFATETRLQRVYRLAMHF